MHPNSLDAYLQRYLEWMREKNYSPRTVEGKEETLSYFMRWCHERALMAPQEITRLILERYQRHLFLYRKRDGQPLAAKTQWARMIPVRLFFRWLAKQNVILYNPAADLELPRVGKRLPKHILSVKEAEAVLAVPDVSTPQGIRDRAILETFYSTGIRRLELINLKVLDIDYERETLMVRQGKGKKDRVVPIGERALEWLIKYRDDVRPEMPQGEGVLFLTNQGKPFMARQISDLVRERIDAAKIGKRGSCHLFRHTMATLMLEGGADIRYVQAMLGHESLEATQIYTKVSIRKLKEVHTLTHPGKPIEGLNREGMEDISFFAALEGRVENE